jgi:hypothetical protein
VEVSSLGLDPLITALAAIRSNQDKAEKNGGAAASLKEFEGMISMMFG